MSEASPSLKRFQRLAKAAQLGLGMLFAGFACTLGMKVVDDLDALFKPVDRQGIAARLRDEHLDARLEELQRQRLSLDEKRVDLEAGRAAADARERNLRGAYQSFLEARSVTQSSADNAAVREKLRQLEDARALQAGWQGELDAVATTLRTLERSRAQLQQAQLEEQRVIQQAQSDSERARSVWVFLVRLVVVAPVVGAALWLWVKRRKTGVWPLVWGFLVFALWMFFVGLVPYLPDFGGYIRASGGVLLTALACLYTARELKRLLERRAQELAASQEERARRVAVADGIKAFLNHSCPACETSFTLVHARPDGEHSSAPGFCAACGLMLFRGCPQCGAAGFAHLPHCTCCGADMQVAPAPRPPTTFKPTVAEEAGAGGGILLATP